MKPIRLLAILFIIACTAAAWFILGSALTVRSQKSADRLNKAVASNWGAPLEQIHPSAYYIAPTAARTKRIIQPDSSAVQIHLEFEKKRKGLVWYRAYTADFDASYVIRNPTPITQTFYVSFALPAEDIRFGRFSFELDGEATGKSPRNGVLTESLRLAPEESVSLRLAYTTAGLDRWAYSFGDVKRLQGFQLDMTTNFTDIDFAEGSESPPDENRELTEDGWRLSWDYDDVIGARSIAMEMPGVTNPGPVAARITFFAPVSLVFFFAVMLILGSTRGVDLHPMNYFFLAAGCFAFQLLFAYLVDLVPTPVAFLAGATVSLVLVTSYVAALAGWAFARLSATAQFAYMILFSLSFFFDGLTGITITVGAIVTLALLMHFTANVDWSEVFAIPGKRSKSSVPGSAGPTPPPMPSPRGA